MAAAWAELPTGILSFEMVDHSAGWCTEEWAEDRVAEDVLGPRSLHDLSSRSSRCGIFFSAPFLHVNCRTGRRGYFGPVLR